MGAGRIAGESSGAALECCVAGSEILQAHRGAYEEGLQLQAELLLTQGHTNAAHELLLNQATNGLFTARHRATAWVTLAELAAARGREQELRQAGPRALELPLTPDESWRLGMRFARAQLRLTGQLSYGASA